MFNLSANDQRPSLGIPAFAAAGGGAGGWFRLMTFQLPLGDLGGGAVDTTPARAVGSGTPTFTRATTAWTKLSSGLWAQVNSGVARSSYLGLDTTVGAYGGYLAEGQRTNEVLWSRDLTNAAWVKTTTTATLDQTGIDGAANSASSLTATGANSTTLQVITEAAATREFSAFVKRITGVGEIDMTEDGGLTWTNITARINSATYTQVTIPTQSVLNPSVGFRIVTSGDKIAVDMCQNEAGAFASSPIPTTTVAVTRNADVLTYAFAGNALTSNGTCYAEFTATTITVAAVASWVGTSTTGRFLESATVTNVRCIDSATNVAVVGSAVTPNISSATITKAASSWSVAGGMTVIATGATIGKQATFVSMDSGNPIGIGCFGTGGNQIYGTIRNVRIFSRQLPDGVLQSMTT